MREEACVIVSQWDAPIDTHGSKGAGRERGDETVTPPRNKVCTLRIPFHP